MVAKTRTGVIGLPAGINVVMRGTVWCEAAEDVHDPGSVIALDGTDALGSGSPGPGRTLVPGARWERPCKAGEIVRVGIYVE
jgi:hypothetical protein